MFIKTFSMIKSNDSVQCVLHKNLRLNCLNVYSARPNKINMSSLINF